MKNELQRLCDKTQIAYLIRQYIEAREYTTRRVRGFFR